MIDQSVACRTEQKACCAEICRMCCFWKIIALPVGCIEIGAACAGGQAGRYALDHGFQHEKWERAKQICRQQCAPCCEQKKLRKDQRATVANAVCQIPRWQLSQCDDGGKQHLQQKKLSFADPSLRSHQKGDRRKEHQSAEEAHAVVGVHLEILHCTLHRFSLSQRQSRHRVSGRIPRYKSDRHRHRTRQGWLCCHR